MQRNVVSWFEIRVKEMNRTMVFYGHVFQRRDCVDCSNQAVEMRAFP